MTTLTKTIRLSPDVLHLIRANTEWFEHQGRVAARIGVQLKRKTYIDVSRALEALGGKWNKKAQAHLFEDDPRPQVVEMLQSGVVMVEKDGFFRTPPPVALRMLGLFSRPVTRNYNPDNEWVLEPSAGDGAIADVLVEEGVPHGRIHVFEKNEKRRAILDRKKFCVVGHDCLLYRPQTKYNFVVMNPPFENQQDIDHVTHMFWHCLALQGELVSVLGEGAFFRDNAKAEKFRQLVEEYGYDEQLPELSFRESGTDVRTRLVYLRKTHLPIHQMQML